jgi:putative ABC transport system permease protein
VLPLLGVQPAIGRGFTADDDKPGAAGVVLLTHELWMRRYGGKRSVVGETLVMNGAQYEIVGVLPAGFRFPSNVMMEALLPYQLPERPVWGGAGVILTEAMGRPRAGVSMEQALAELSAISARYQSQMPRFYFDPTRPSRITAISLQEKLVGKTRPALLALVWSVGILLLIACVNVANLQLARAAVRQREMGLRAALGASRARIAQWLGAEIAVVGGLACLVALAVAYGVLAVLRASNGVPVGDPAVFHGGWPLVTMTLAISAAAAVFAGVLPAFTAPGIELNEVLKSGALAVMGGRGVRTRSALVLIQVALALVLLIGSGVLLRSLQRVIAVNWGFRPERLLTAELRLPAMRYDTPAKQRAFTEALVERVGVLPGVESAATSSSLPLTRYLGSATILIEGQPVTQQVQRPGSPILVVSPGYFHTLGTPLLSGRQFNASDIAGAAPVAIVNSTFGRKFFPAGDAVGRRFLRGQSQRFTTIIGVTADMRQGGRESVVDTEVFVPVAQNPVRQVDLIVRARVDAASLAPSVRSAVWSVDKDQPIFAVSTMDDLIRRSGANRTLETLLLTCFGVLAMALAAIGIYGVVAETVGQRTREIGVRMALGAQSGDVLRMILGRCLVLAIGGVAVGAGAGFYLVRYLRTMVFGVEPRDAAAFAGAGLVLLAVAAIAGYLPARQAARIDPAVTLRCE